MFLIRADGNAKIGAGHLMRCMAIADAAAEFAGGKDGILFLCADEESAGLAHAHGFRAEVLHTDYRDLESELPRWKPAMQADAGSGDKIILADSYYVTEKYLQALRAYGKVYLMDDLQEQVYPVDGVVNYNVFADRAWYEEMYAGRETTLLLGGAYIPLRSQFAGVRYQPAGQVREVLITTGGGDADNIAETLLDLVARPEMHFHVLVGRFSPHFESWQKRAQAEQNISVHCDVQDMAGLMRSCDLALTAGGSTIYELAAVGVPFLCFSYARNQEALTGYIGRNGIAGCAGDWHLDQGETTEKIRQLFEQFCRDDTLRRRCSEAERKLTDGHGARRLAAALLQGTV